MTQHSTLGSPKNGYHTMTTMMFNELETGPVELGLKTWSGQRSGESPEESSEVEVTSIKKDGKFIDLDNLLDKENLYRMAQDMDPLSEDELLRMIEREVQDSVMSSSDIDQSLSGDHF